MPQTSLPEKVFAVERWRCVENVGEQICDDTKVGDVEYRIGYYIIAQNGKRAGSWLWGSRRR
jgi:hypothetical protein